VARYGITLEEWSVHDGLLPGIQALILALDGSGGAIGVATGLTNLFMLATFWRISDGGRGRIRLLALLLTLGAALNLSWFVLSDNRWDLYAGYYAWVSSFGLVGAGLWRRAYALPEESPEPGPAIAP
jgi:hypothetical protein